jgi:thiamine biosynthesis protein ThiS
VRLVVNGTERDVRASTVAELLAELAIPSEGFAVAVERAVVPRGEHAGTVLREGQTVEIIRAVGGG